MMRSAKGLLTRRGFSLLLALVLTVSLLGVPAAAYEVDYTKPQSELPSLALGAAPAATAGASFDNKGEGQDWISMTEARSFEAKIPVAMSADNAKAAIESSSFKWTLGRSAPYLSAELYPNYKKGGDLTAWQSNSRTPLFTDIKTGVLEESGAVYLTVSFNCILFYADESVPHGSATNTMDYIGWYSLAAENGGTGLGSVAVKVVPYDDFRTMGEVYDEIDALAAYQTGYYVKRQSMGVSEAGYDMPYLIVAKNQQAVDKWLTLCDTAETNPDQVLTALENGQLGDFQVPVIFSNIHSNETPATDSILNFAWMLLKEKSVDYKMLTGFTEAGKAQLQKEMGPAGVKDSVAVPDLVSKSSTFLGYLTDKNNGISGVVDLDTYYTKATEKVDVSKLMDDVFFILVPEENVEGRIYMSRVSSGGLDLNRDNSFQTQNETQNMQRLIGQFNPVSLTEIHGRVKSFQCEPCDPPHEPNFEYDLLARHLMPGGEAFGIASVANNDGYNSYVIPQRDYLSYTGKTLDSGAYETYWSDPWDDMSTSYTPQFAMLHGCVAYTVEVPAYNDTITRAMAYGQLGQSAYIAKNKESFLQAQVEIFKRGVTNFNSNGFDKVGQWFCDQYDVEGAEAALFRPEFNKTGENGNFYPECYIIPMDPVNQTNLQAAADMMKWLARNDVKILVTKSPVAYEGVTYPAGTMIVSMYQAKRSVANGALYDGTLIQNWTVLYSEGITTFNETRGFDMVTCAKPAAYQSLYAACGKMMDYADCLQYLADVTSSFTGTPSYQVIISNASEDAAAAVNTLLQAGKTVGMVTEGAYKGDFICSYTDWRTVSGSYLLSGTGLAGNYPAARVITKSPVIYINGVPADAATGYINTNRINNYNYNYDRQAMDLMNFKTTTNVSAADVIAGASNMSNDALAAVQAGKPYIGYGTAGAGSSGSASTLGRLFNGITRQSVSGSMDALAYVTYPTETLVNASYIKDGDDVMYGYGAGYYAAVPPNAQVLVRIDSTRLPTEGFLRASDAVNLAAYLGGSIQGFSYQGNDRNGNMINVALFANSLTHKVHQRDEYAFISNFAFSSMLGGAYVGAATPSAMATGLTTNTPSVIQLKRGRTLQLSPGWAPASVKNLDISYSSLNPAIATVGPKTGLITAVKAGMTLVMLKAQDGSGRTAQVVVTVVT